MHVLTFHVEEDLLAGTLARIVGSQAHVLADRVVAHILQNQ
jgi:hypothetical protein